MTILLFGDINLDVTLHVDAYPNLGEDVIVQRYHAQPGGSIANTAITLAHLGYPVRLIGRTGQDATGDQAIAALVKAGVDITFVQRDPEAPTGQVFIIVTRDGERTMFSARGANARIPPESIRCDVLEGISRLHLSTYSFLTAPQDDAAQKLIQVSLENNILCSLDVAEGHTRLMRTVLDPLIPELDMLLISPSDAANLLNTSPEMLGNDIAKAIQGLGAHQVMLKLGARGCIAITRQFVQTLPGLPAAVVDSTGAGDAFAAGLIYAMQQGFPLIDAARFANAMGALTTTVSGAGNALPGRNALIAYLTDLPARYDEDGWRDRLIAHLAQR
jgi:ribokinase